MLKATQGLSARIKFFEDGQHVALFDGGPCDLVFNDGKEYSFATWMPDWIENPVFPKGSANIACIADYHYQIVSDEALADMTHFAPSGEITYYKEGELEIVAHVEIPLDGKSEWVIVCNKKQYKVVYTRKRFGFRSELFQDDQPVALINERFFWTSADFKKNLPLSDRVFITLLARDWSPESAQDEKLQAEEPTDHGESVSELRLAFTDSRLSSDVRAAAFDEWIQTFYMWGNTDELAKALKYFVSSEEFELAADISLFTFARAATLFPEAVAGYESLLDEEDLPGRDYVRAVIALVKGRMPSTLPIEVHPRFLRSSSALALPIRTGADLDCLWVEFFLSGDTDAVEKIADVAVRPDWFRGKLEKWLQLPVHGLLGRWQQARALNGISRTTGIVFDKLTGNIATEGDLDLLAFRNAAKTQMAQHAIRSIVSALPFDCSEAEIERWATKAAADWSLNSLSATNADVRDIYPE